jgi:hypothetical protein
MRPVLYNAVVIRAVIFAGCCAVLLGCGTGGSGVGPCKPVGFLMTVGPASEGNAAPDHTEPPPGNQERFQAGIGGVYGPGCATSQVLHLTPAQWTTSDPKDVTISSAADATNGLATCVGAANATVSATLTSDGFTQTKSASIVCK